MGAKAAGAMVGHEGAEGSPEGLEEVVSGLLKLRGNFIGDFNFSDEGKVVAIALVGDVNDGALAEGFEETILPDRFVKDRVVDEVIEVTPTGSKAGRSGESIEFGLHGSTRFVECGKHRATDIG